MMVLLYHRGEKTARRISRLFPCDRTKSNGTEALFHFTEIWGMIGTAFAKELRTMTNYCGYMGKVLLLDLDTRTTQNY